MSTPSPVPTPPDGKAAVVVIFHHLDPAHEPAVREYLTAESLLPGYFEPMTAQLQCDEGYGKLAAGMTACTQISDAIVERDPQAVFEVCQDPAVNYAGERLVVHPELGRYRSAADENGTGMITTGIVAHHLRAVRELLARGEDPGPALDALDATAGGPWDRDIDTRYRRRHGLAPRPPAAPATVPAVGATPSSTSRRPVGEQLGPEEPR